MASWREALRARYRRWLDRRIPRARRVTLDQRRIFIFPGRRGLAFVVLLLLMFLGGINYANNQVLLLCFLLASVMNTAILHTYRNLSGLTFEASRAQPGFAGEAVDLEILLHAARGRQHRGLVLRWAEAAEVRVDIDPQRPTRLRFSMPVHARGRYVPPRIELESHFPLGLVRAWSFIALDMQVLVWPKPVAGDLPLADGGAEESPQADGRRPRGVDEFEGLVRYVPGDSLMRVDWRVYARTEQLVTKRFTEPGRSRLWLDYAAFGALDTESRLSHLCHWAVEMERCEQPYGLRLPGLEITPAQGDAHHRRVLDALAEFTP